MNYEFCPTESCTNLLRFDSIRLTILIAITVIECRAMMFPTGHTNPAELVSTRLITTYNVVTPAILFNRCFTLWTFFCVGMDPVVCFTINLFSEQDQSTKGLEICCSVFSKITHFLERILMEHIDIKVTANT